MSCNFYEKSLGIFENCFEISRQNFLTFSFAKSAWIYCSVAVEYVRGTRTRAITPQTATQVKNSQLQILQKVKNLCTEISAIDLEAAREFQELAAEFLKKLPQVIELVEKGATYTEVSLEEKKAIFAAMTKEVGSGTHYGGHWFTCRRGHVYTIGECGGAMQQSRCPECGDVVGGGGHRLADGNSAAQEFLREVNNQDEG